MEKVKFTKKAKLNMCAQCNDLQNEIIQKLQHIQNHRELYPNNKYRVMYELCLQIMFHELNKITEQLNTKSLLK